VLIGLFTEYTTSYEYEPTRSISRSGATGPATVIIQVRAGALCAQCRQLCCPVLHALTRLLHRQGLGIGQLSTFPPVIIVALALVVCVSISGVFGVALAAVGMLSTLGVTLVRCAQCVHGVISNISM
jgi:K(+)-stimulated pyrophosphate-energized sodium pump